MHSPYPAREEIALSQTNAKGGKIMVFGFALVVDYNESRICNTPGSPIWL